MAVVELLVAVRDAQLSKLFGERTRAPVEVELVARAAVDVDERELPERVRVRVEHLHGVPRLPLAPHLPAHLACLEVDGEIDAEVR